MSDKPQVIEQVFRQVKNGSTMMFDISENFTEGYVTRDMIHEWAKKHGADGDILTIVRAEYGAELLPRVTVWTWRVTKDVTLEPW